MTPTRSLGLTVSCYTGNHEPIDINGVLTPNPRGLPPQLLRNPDKWVAARKAEIDQCEPGSLILFNRPGGAPQHDADPTTPEKLELCWWDHIPARVIGDIADVHTYALMGGYKIAEYVGPVRVVDGVARTIHGDNYDDREHFRVYCANASSRLVRYAFIDTGANVGAWERLEDIAESYGITLVGEGEGRDTPRNPNRVWCGRSSKGPEPDDAAKWTQFRRTETTVTIHGFEIAKTQHPPIANTGHAPYIILVGGADGHVDSEAELRDWAARGYTLHPWTGPARDAIKQALAPAGDADATAKEAEV